MRAPGSLTWPAPDAASAAEQAGFPVALKVSAAGIAHKTDVGGVVVGIESADAAARAYDQIIAAVSAAAPGTPIEGVLVSPMRAGGVDLLVGVVRDETWGLTLVVGLGGIWVEVLADSAVRALPVTPGEVREMLTELKSFPLLTGSRGAEPVETRCGLPGDAEPLQSTAPYGVLRRDIGEIAPLRHVRCHFGEVTAMTRQDDRYVEDQERYNAGRKS